MLQASDIKTIEHDVVVIGAGGAGLRAATQCANLGLGLDEGAGLTNMGVYP